MANGEVNPFRLQLSIEGWPVREEESVILNEGFYDEKRVSIDPPNFRLGIGPLLDLPTGSSFVENWRGNFAAEWHGEDKFGVGFSLGVKFFRTPWGPNLGIKFSGPISASEEAGRERFQFAPQLAWPIVNYNNLRVEAAANFNLPALAGSDPLINGPSAGLLISFGSENNTRTKRAFVEHFSPPPQFHETHLTWVRADIGLPPIQKEVKKAAIFIEAETWKRLKSNHMPLFRQYLASIATDYEGLDGYDVQFEIHIGNWSEHLAPSSLSYDHRPAFKSVRDIQTTLKRYSDEGSLIGSLMFGDVPYMPSQYRNDTDYKGHSDLPYRFPKYNFNPGHLGDEGYMVGSEERQGLEDSRQYPVGWFPADPSIENGMDVMAKLMQNAIHYREGRDSDGIEQSQETIFYSSPLDSLVGGDDERIKLLNDIAPNVRFINPLGENFLADRKREFLQALSGSGQIPPSHVVFFSDHGGTDQMSFSDWNPKGTKNRKYVTPEDFETSPAGANFIYLGGCYMAGGANIDNGIIHDMVMSGSVVGIAAYFGYGNAERLDLLQWAVLADLELRMPHTLGLRIYETPFFTPLDTTPSALTRTYFGDPFVRFTPFAYRESDTITRPIVTDFHPSEFSNNEVFGDHLRYLLFKALKKNDVKAVQMLLPFFKRSSYLSPSSLRCPNNCLQHINFYGYDLNFELQMLIYPFLEDTIQRPE